jgi:hypothetical protein
MLTVINSNKPQLVKKLAIQIPLVLVFILSVVNVFNLWGPPPDTVHLLLRIVLCIILILLNVYMFVQLLYLPTGVSIDDSAKKFTVTFLMLKKMEIELDAIKDYSSTMVYTKKKDNEGVLVHLKTGKTLLLSNFNLNNYKPVETFFKKAKVKYLGKEDFSFMPYYTQWFK